MRSDFTACTFCTGMMSFRDHVRLSDMKALIAFVETSEDVDCLEDVLHMILGLLSHKQFILKFVEHVFTLGGCHVFVNLLKR